VRVEADGEIVGSIWATRAREAGEPNREETRLLALAADQIGLAVRRDRLAREATEAEIARRSDTLKSALIDSVSHDLRTPLAAIRATAGSLDDPVIDWTSDERRQAARSIDAEAERLDRLVRNFLDLGRIEAGELRPDIEVHELRALVEPAVARARASAGAHDLEIAIPDDLPLVAVDAVFVDAIVTNLLDNAARHAAGSPVAIRAQDGGAGRVDLVVEDGGPGVPDEALVHLFDRFYRVRRQGEGARRGLGIGLSIVSGLAHAMGGEVRATRSALGGLSIHVTLPTAVPLDDEAPA
jgi:two-component system sensor histidine kinase KdpD